MDGFYYENNKVVPYKGLIEVDGSFYYIAEHGKAVTDKVHFVQNTNELTCEDGTQIKKGYYMFDETGKMIFP